MGGRATASGTVTCSDPGWVTISGELSRRVGRKSVAQGSFGFLVLCNGTSPTDWSAITLGPQRPEMS